MNFLTGVEYRYQTKSAVVKIEEGPSAMYRKMSRLENVSNCVESVRAEMLDFIGKEKSISILEAETEKEVIRRIREKAEQAYDTMIEGSNV